MINFDRDRFSDMDTEQKIAFVNDLVVKNQKLNPEEIEYLVPQNREKYFYNRARTSDWLEDYEFNHLSEKEKEIYIWNKRFLEKNVLQNLEPNMQKEYITKTITSGVHLTPEEFQSLDNDELREFYAKEKIKYAMDTTFTPEELGFLDADEQIQYINTVIRMGLAPNPDELPAFKPKAMRYYQSHKTLNEIRSIIRSEIKNIL